MSAKLTLSQAVEGVLLYIRKTSFCSQAGGRTNGTKKK
jgi:hypothetical protein